MSALSDRVTRLSTTFLGPAAKTFLERQTMRHMRGLQLESLEAKHLPELARWVETSAILLIDKPKVQVLTAQILKAAS